MTVKGRVLDFRREVAIPADYEPDTGDGAADLSCNRDKAVGAFYLGQPSYESDNWSILRHPQCAPCL